MGDQQSPTRASTSFSFEEVEMLSQLMDALLRDKGYHHFARRPEFGRVLRKAKSMRKRILKQLEGGSTR